MKRFILTILTLSMILSTLSSLASCDRSGDREKDSLSDTEFESIVETETDSKAEETATTEAEDTSEEKTEELTETHSSETTEESTEYKEETAETSNEKVSSAETEPETAEESESFEQMTENDSLALEAYKNIECAEQNRWQYLHFSFKGEATVLRCYLPTAWEFTNAAGGFTISFDGNDIGSLSLGAPSLDGYKVIEAKEHEYNGISLTERLVAKKRIYGRGYEFYRMFTYNASIGSGTKVVTMCFDYAELQEKYMRNFTERVFTANKNNDPYLGSLKKTVVGQKSILVLGNSFIGSSSIGSFLNQMFSGTGCTVTARSVGYASVSRGDWEGYLDDMRNGTYDYIFMCGFYSPSDATALKPYVEACQASGTTLVIFPAHNESYGHTAQSTYPSVPTLDWKQEIDDLMKTYDIDVWDFCINDTHKHSTALAGYVGAHMIFRAVTGRYPNENIEYTALSTSYIKSRLGKYMTTGTASSPIENLFEFTNDITT